MSAQDRAWFPHIDPITGEVQAGYDTAPWLYPTPTEAPAELEENIPQAIAEKSHAGWVVVVALVLLVWGGFAVAEKVTTGSWTEKSSSSTDSCYYTTSSFQDGHTVYVDHKC